MTSTTFSVCMYVALGHNSIMVTHYFSRVHYDVPTKSRSLFRSTRGAFTLIFGSFFPILLVVCCDLILATIRPAECLASGPFHRALAKAYPYDPHPTHHHTITYLSLKLIHHCAIVILGRVFRKEEILKTSRRTPVMSDIEKVGHNVAENANRTTRRGERRGSNYAFFRDSGNQVSSIREFKTRT